MEKKKKDNNVSVSLFEQIWKLLFSSNNILMFIFFSFIKYFIHKKLNGIG